MSKMGLERNFIFQNCPENKPLCNGLALDINGGGITIEQREWAYISNTRDDKKTIVTCPNYEGCYEKLVKNYGKFRKPAELKLGGQD